MQSNVCLWLVGLMMVCLPGCAPSVGDDDHVRRCAKPSRHCMLSGRCRPGTELDACVIGADEDCANARVCESFGRCAKGSAESSSALQCVKYPKETGFDVNMQLRGDQACSDALIEGAICRAGSQRCRASDPEQDAGPHSVCVPGSAAHCEKSKVCEAYGRCSVGINACVTASKADCAKSKVCEEHGACSPRTVDGVTFCAVNTGEDCANTAACKSEGKCLADPKAPVGYGCVDAETLAERKAKQQKYREARAERKREAAQRAKVAAKRKAEGLPELPALGGGGGHGAQTCEACKTRCQATTNVAEQKETDDAFDAGVAGIVDLFAETVALEYDSLVVCDKRCAHLCE